MSLIRKHLTAVAVDSFTDFLKEKFEKLKELDLDKDGQKDVDQMLEILANCSKLAKDALDSTDFRKLAQGLDQVLSGFSLLSSSVDSQRLQDALKEFSRALTKLAQLCRLGIDEAKGLD